MPFPTTLTTTLVVYVLIMVSLILTVRMILLVALLLAVMSYLNMLSLILQWKTQVGWLSFLINNLYSELVGADQLFVILKGIPLLVY